MGYLLLLDQIGTAVKPTSWVGAPPTGTSILNALEWFDPATSPKGRKVIYALRCAQAHDFSLFNRNKKDPELQHEFALHRGTGPLFRLPAKPWGGDYTALAAEPTYVSLPVLGDRVKSVCTAVRTAHQRGQLSIGSGLTPEELAQRYTLAVRSS